MDEIHIVALPRSGAAKTMAELTCTTGRPGPVVVVLSVPGSATNRSQISLVLNEKSTHYMYFIEVESRQLMVVYDSVPYGWHEIPY